MEYTWEKNKDVECWMNGEFETIEECINNAKECYGYSPGDTIAIGIIEPYKISVCADTVLEALAEDAYEECGEVSESWNLQNSNTFGDLSDRLTECVKTWLKEQNNMPSFYKISDVRTVEII